PFFTHCRGVNGDPDCSAEVLGMLVDGFKDALIQKYGKKERWDWYQSFLLHVDVTGGLRTTVFNDHPETQLDLVCARIGLDRYLAGRLDAYSRRESLSTCRGMLLRVALLEPNNSSEDLVRTLLKCVISPDDLVECEVDFELGRKDALVELGSPGTGYLGQGPRPISISPCLNPFGTWLPQKGLTCQDMLRGILTAESMALIEHYFPRSKTKRRKSSGLGRHLQRASRWGTQTVKDAIRTFKGKW
ncbi:hypothetical protein V8F33_014232, partial [Rhypophila sp. PSN 637]